MPNRIIRDWTDSERVNAISAGAERFFVRLIMKADDYGCYFGNPQLLKSYLFPLLDVRLPDITRWIAECVKAGLLAEYEVEGKRYVVVTNYGQRMRNSQRKFPPPPTSCGESRQVAANRGGLRLESETETGDENPRRNTTNTQAVIPADGAETAAADDVGAVLTSCQVFRGLPKTAADVLEIADRAGVICTPEMAEAYLCSRQAVNWAKSGGRQIRNLGADVKGFCLTWRQNRADEAKRRLGAAENDPVDIDRAGREARRKRAAELEKEADEWKK